MKSDLGQTTIPFIDIQEVTTITPTLMGGVGLYYKHIKGDDLYVGYLGLKLITYDYTAHISLNKNSNNSVEIEM